MTAAAYTTDLTTLDDASSTWVILAATGWTSAGTVTTGETDSFIQGINCASKTLKTGLGGLMCPALSNFTVPTDGAVLIWLKFSCEGLLDTEANGGIRGIIGNSTSVFYGFKLGGSNTYTYGGWICCAMNDTVTPDYTLGAPASPWQRVGWAELPLSFTSLKGNPFLADCVRVGRCEARFAGGTSPDAACTFAGFAAVNDSNTTGAYNRWGLLQSIAGGYLWQGLMVIGYSAACRFTDSNVNISIQNTKKVTAAFNKVEIRNASTEVNWTNISFSALGTVSKGRLEVVDDCDVNIASCTFQSMDTFIWKAASDVLNSRFIGCGQITANGAKFNGTSFSGFEGTANTSYLLWNTNVNTNGKLDGCTFTKGTVATHAIEIADSGLTALTLTNVTFSGYNASNNQDDSAIHVKKADGTVTITISGGTTPSYRSDGATVEFVTSSVTVAVAVKDIGGSNVVGARILLKAISGTGTLPVDVTVTIANSGTTATVTHSGHGMITNDWVLIHGASHWQNNGVFAITRIDDNSYSYTMPEAPGSNPTGTIKATFVALYGLSGSDGTLSTNRSYASSQTVNGWVRKASSAPYYKESPLGGTVSSSSGYSGTAILTLDQ